MTTTTASTTARERGAATLTPERPAATLPLPNTLAYVVAVVAVAATVMVPFAVAASGKSMTEALVNYEFNTVAFGAVLGAVILRRRPGHVIGWVLVTAGGCDALFHIGHEYRQFGGASGASVDAGLAWLWIPSAAALVVALPQLFPDGRLLSRRWLPLAIFGAATTAMLSIAFFGATSAAGAGVGLAFPLFTVAGLASLAPLVVRYRRSRGVERQQLKCLFYGFAVFLPISGVDTLTPDGSPTAVLTLLPFIGIPAVIAIAVVRYRLYDVDVVISRTLLVAGLVGFITVAYVAIVVGLGRWLVGAVVVSRMWCCRCWRRRWWRWRSSRCVGGCSGWRIGWFLVGGRRRMTC